MRTALRLAIAAILLVAPRPASSQESRPAWWGVWVAGASGSPFVTREGVKHRDFYQVALRYDQPLFDTPGLRLHYLLDLVPAAVSTNDPVGFEWTPCGDYLLCSHSQTRTVYAAGVTPIGLGLQFFPDSPVSFQLTGTAGMLWFTHAIPDPEAGAFNFTAAAGLAADVDLTRGFALTVGLLGHHTSNGGTARANPGLNSRMLVVGLAHSRR